MQTVFFAPSYIREYFVFTHRKNDNLSSQRTITRWYNECTCCKKSELITPNLRPCFSGFSEEKNNRVFYDMTNIHLLKEKSGELFSPPK